MATMRPIRLQLRRTRGFRLQEFSFRTNGLTAVVVDRASTFGNPFSIESLGRRGAIEAFRRLILNEMSDDEIRRYSQSGGWGDDGKYLTAVRNRIQSKIELIQGKNLACWCHPTKECHADFLLDFAYNRTPVDNGLDPLQRMVNLEKENARLKKLVADLTLEKQVHTAKRGI